MLFETVVSVIIMVLSSFVGMFVGSALLNSPAGGAILFALISGIAYIVYVLTCKPQTLPDDTQQK